MIALNEIIKIFRAAQNPEKAAPMKAYMRHRYEYLGLPKPERAALSKEFMKTITKCDSIDWEMVWTLWEQQEREFQYLAINYLEKMNRHLQKEDINKIAKLITWKSWWDSVDSMVNLVGPLVLSYPELQEEVIKKWALQENIWLKRMSIIYQLKYKQDTDPDFLKFAILNNCNTREFFLNKAIGWALREYSKTDADWVRHFINDHELNSLSIREGSKYI